MISTKSMATRRAALEPAPHSLPSPQRLCLLLAHPSSPHFLLSLISEGAALLFSFLRGSAGWGQKTQVSDPPAKDLPARGSFALSPTPTALKNPPATRTSTSWEQAGIGKQYEYI